MATAFICKTCGVQFEASAAPPEQCPICEDARQYVGHDGQRWTTIDELRRDGSHNTLEAVPDEPMLSALGCAPALGIGQRALIVATEAGNVMWDCVPCLPDRQLARELAALGGVRAIAISHPHFHSTMIDWAELLDAEIWLHADDRQWIMRGRERVTLWSGEVQALFGGLTLHRLGGHFAGGQVLHVPHAAEGRGALLTGDIIQVAMDRDWVSFMYSYPNLIPLPADTVADINARVQRLDFDRLYGGWPDKRMVQDARVKVARSAQRYIDALAGHFPPPPGGMPASGQGSH